MKTIIKAVILFLAFSLIIYLLFSFYYLSINPKVWSETGRFVYLGFVFSAMIVSYPIIEATKE